MPECSYSFLGPALGQLLPTTHTPVPTDSRAGKCGQGFSSFLPLLSFLSSLELGRTSGALVRASGVVRDWAPGRGTHVHLVSRSLCGAWAACSRVRVEQRARWQVWLARRLSPADQRLRAFTLTYREKLREMCSRKVTDVFTDCSSHSHRLELEPTKPFFPSGRNIYHRHRLDLPCYIAERASCWSQFVSNSLQTE